MDPLHEYADHWLRRASARIERPRFLGWTREWIAEIELARPGFASALRSAALAALESDDERLAHSAVGALAIVGQPLDIEAIGRAAKQHGGRVEREAHTAIFEIKHPPAAS
jgi:hypothetical protein